MDESRPGAHTSSTMKTNLIIDDDLIRTAARLTGTKEKASLVRLGLEAVGPAFVAFFITDGGPAAAIGEGKVGGEDDLRRAARLGVEGRGQHEPVVAGALLLDELVAGNDRAVGAERDAAGLAIGELEQAGIKGLTLLLVLGVVAGVGARGALADRGRTLESVLGHLAAGEQRITALRLRVGTLSGAVPDAMRFAWDVVSRDTIAAGARLEIESLPAAGWCAVCQVEFECADFLNECPRCHNLSGDLRRGRELDIAAVELE